MSQTNGPKDGYSVRHVVGLADTSVAGNVYFANYIEWQGRVRERFLHEHCPEALRDIVGGKIHFATSRCDCDFRGSMGFSLGEEVEILMRVDRFRGGRMTIGFEYRRFGRSEAPVAFGHQEVSSLKRAAGGSWMPAPFPTRFVEALLRHTSDPAVRANLEDSLVFLASQAAAVRSE